MSELSEHHWIWGGYEARIPPYFTHEWLTTLTGDPTMTRPRIATGNISGHDGPVLLVEMSGGWCGFYTNAGGAWHRWYSADQVTNVRPLATVDPLDWQATIVALEWAAERAALDTRPRRAAILISLRDQLAAQQPTPPLPDEPGAGAVLDLCASTAHIQRWGRAEDGWHRLTDGAGPRTWAELHKRGTVTEVAAGL